jgi:CRISPR-associated exonuclease Cas4
MLIVSFILLLLSSVLFWLSTRQRKQAGVPGGRVIYSDTRAWGPLEKPLYDAGLGLAGKPDYLVEQNGRILPVEVKTGRTPPAPYDAHIYQVAVYCLLVEKTYGIRPPHGIIHYPGRDFAVDYTPGMESALLDLLVEIRRDERRASVERSHADPARCQGCGFRSVCDQKLG